MMRRNVLFSGLVLAIFLLPVVAMGGEKAASSAEAASAVAQPAPSCWDPEVKRCCDVATLPAPVQCSVDGYTWTCAPTIQSNPLVQVMVQSKLGYEGKQAGRTLTCKFTNRTCGSSINTCNNALQGTADCQEELPTGDLCQSDN